MNDFVTDCGPPLNGGTRAPLNAAATQLPTGVPENGPSTDTEDAEPLGENMTVARPRPFGPPGFPQPDAAPADAVSAERAALTLNSPAGFVSGFAGSGLVGEEEP